MIPICNILPALPRFGKVQHVDANNYWVKTPDAVGIKVSKSLNSEPEVALVEGDHVELVPGKSEQQLVSVINNWNNDDPLRS